LFLHLFKDIGHIEHSLYEIMQAKCGTGMGHMEGCFN
jgi:hypothetical protein